MQKLLLKMSVTNDKAANDSVSISPGQETRWINICISLHAHAFVRDGKRSPNNSDRTTDQRR